MHAATMTALEFEGIQQELAGFASCQLGKELALAILPLDSPAHIRQAQQETTEAAAILAGGRSAPFGGIQDVRLYVERADQGGVLRPEQLAAVADTIYGCRQLHGFLTDHRSNAPVLARHAEAFGPFDQVEAEIRRCIERGAVSSRASRELKQIRSELAVIEGRIQDRLNGLLRQYRQHLQDALVTTRDGRYVIPIKASARAAVPGTVHGASASGATLFVEPEAIRHLCGELESWRAMEVAEIEQVLTALSGLVAGHTHGLRATLAAVAQLDLIFARARLSRAWDARAVAWNESGIIDLKGARHPLLGRAAIGNRIRLTAGARMLIVTGPNTGGKTLLLKTLGLLVIIARCGMHIPVDEGSTLCHFADVFADIGDHQSLAQSLSTFSGHIANVAPMLDQAGPHTLILLDELGSGTDPHEGTALGIAVLESFLEKGAYTLATTHLREIKEFSRVTAGCAYAGMGFDGETLQPTYQLIYDTLGQSHGLEIAARVGLPAAVVERARHLIYGSGDRPADGQGNRSGGRRRGELEGAPAPPAAAAVADSPPAPVATPEGAPAAAAAPEREHAPAPAPAPLPPPQPRPADPADALSPVLAAVSPSRCRVWHDGALRELTVRDAVRRRLPGGLVPGDRVRVAGGQAVEVANRRTWLVNRDADTQVESVIAANLTRLLVVVSARQPDFHSAMLARHLFYAERHGVTPIICLTKADLVKDAEADAHLAPFRALGYPAVAVSAARGRGLDGLRPLLHGQHTAVIGYPGAGKTTLLAALAAGGEPVVSLPAGGAARQRPQPGVLLLAPDAWLLDLPGLKALGVWKPDLAGGFPEFGPHVGLCSRPGCLHRQEPGCAVRQAAEQGLVDSGRYRQYLHLLQCLRMG